MFGSKYTGRTLNVQTLEASVQANCKSLRSLPALCLLPPKMENGCKFFRAFIVRKQEHRVNSSQVKAFRLATIIYWYHTLKKVFTTLDACSHLLNISVYRVYYSDGYMLFFW